MDCSRIFSRNLMASLFTTALVLLAMELSAQFGSLRFEKISSANGLSFDQVNTIVRDKTGYIWFGTRSGLNRYDGFDIQIFRHSPNDSSSVCNNEFLSSICTSNGELWFGTVDGLSRYEENSKSFKTAEIKLKSAKAFAVKCLLEDSKERLWIGSNQGLYFKNPTSDEIKPISNLSQIFAALDSLPINDLFLHDGEIYVASSANLFKLNLNDTTIKEIKLLSPEIENSSLQQVLVDSDKNLWLGFKNSALLKINLASGEKTEYNQLKVYSNGVSINQMSELQMDKQGRIWCSTGKLSLSTYDKSKDSFINLKEIPYITAFDNTRSAKSIFVDDDGSLWLAMDVSGVMHFNPNRVFISYERPDGVSEHDESQVLRNNWTRVCAEDNRDNLWIATLDGISILDRENNEFKSLVNVEGRPKVLADNSIRSLLNVDDKYMLVGTANGLSKYSLETGAFQHFYPNKEDKFSLVGGFIYDMTLGNDDFVYLATSGGFCQYDYKSDLFNSWSEFPELSKYLGCNCRSVRMDSKGIIWIGTSNCGLLEFNPKTESLSVHEDFETNPEILGDTPLDIYDDGEILWIGSMQGMVLFDKSAKTFSNFKFPKGSNPGMVSNLFKDEEHRLWMTSTEGLISFNSIDSSFRYYNSHHGLPTLSFHFQRSYFTHDGFLCLPSLKGLVMFKPADITNSSTFPIPKITEIKVLNDILAHTVFEDNFLDLKYDQNFFIVNLNTFDYLRKDNIHYAFRLKGLHEDWIDNGRSRQLSFNAVPGGDYNLQYMATASIGEWPSEYQELLIHIDTVYYKQWWFRLLLLLTLLAVFYFVDRYRKNQRKKIERLRTKIASDLHDDIGSTLSSIRMYSDLALAKKVDTEPLLSRISENAKEMIDSMGDMVWAIKPGKDKFSDLEDRIVGFMHEMCGPSEITVHVNIDSAFNSMKINMEQRRDIYLICKEAINNAAKYSKCSNLHLEIIKLKDYIFIDIYDDGIGFDLENQSSGNGLESMKSRVQSMQGQFDIQTKMNRGTKIHISLPLTNFG